MGWWWSALTTARERLVEPFRPVGTPAHTCGYEPPDPDPQTLATLKAIHTHTNRVPP